MVKHSKIMKNRTKVVKRWRDGRIRDNLPDATKEEIDIFIIGYNMGRKSKNIYEEFYEDREMANFGIKEYNDLLNKELEQK